LGNLPLNLFLISLNQLDTLHYGQPDRKVLVRVDVSEPVFDRGGKLDLLEHVFACLLEDELDHFLRVHAQESLAAFGVAVPLADYLVDDAPMAAKLEVLFCSAPWRRPS
jgi:hypothetical protein